MVIPLPPAAGLLSDLLWLAKEPHPPPSSHPPLFWRPRSNLIQQGTALQGSCNRDSGPGWTCKGLALLGRQLWLLYLRWWQPHHQKRQGRGVLSSLSLRVKKDTPCPPHPHPGAWSSTVETHKPEACPRCSVSHLSPKYPIPSPWIPSCHIENLVKQENFQLCKHWESFRQWRATLVITMANLKCQWSLNDIVQREKNTKRRKRQSWVQVPVLEALVGIWVVLLSDVSQQLPIAQSTVVLSPHLWMGGCMAMGQLFNLRG